MKKNSNYFLLLFFAFIFPSCRESCNCTKDLGCTILTANEVSDQQVIEKKSYCSENNYYSDPVLADSVNAFTLRHQGGYTHINRKDSIYYSQTTEKVPSKETGYYEKLGYSCICFK